MAFIGTASVQNTDRQPSKSFTKLTTAETWGIALLLAPPHSPTPLHGMDVVALEWNTESILLETSMETTYSR